VLCYCLETDLREHLEELVQPVATDSIGSCFDK